MSYSSSEENEVFQDDWMGRNSPVDALPHSELVQVLSPHRRPFSKRKKQPANPKDKFDLTVIGALFSLFESHTQALSQDFLTQHIAARLDHLRRSDGSKYSKSPEKIVAACLSNTDLFAKGSGGWVLRSHNAERFKERMMQTLLHRAARKREHKEKVLPQEFKDVKGNDKAFRTVLLMERLSRFMQGRKDFQHHFQKPFGKFLGKEEITEVAQEMGNEKFLGVLIGCEMLKDYFSGLCYRTSNLSSSPTLSKDFDLLNGMAGSILAQAHAHLSP